MPSLYLRGRVYQYEFVDENGKTVQRSLRTSSLADAQSKVRAIEQHLARIEESRAAAGVATVADLCKRYQAWAERYYRKNGELTSQITAVRSVVEALDPYASTLVTQFGPLCLKETVTRWIADDLTRTTINKYIGQAKRIFKWGVSEEICPPAVYQAVATVEGLRAGRTEAKESEPVKPVPEAHIAKAKEKLPPTLQAMIDLQLLTGARPGEILGLRPCDIDRSGAIWTVDLSGRHKTVHHGKSRTLYIGPKAQAVLRPYLLNRGPADYLFNPREAIAERSADCETHRRPNQAPSPRKTDRTVGDRYDTHAYRKAIERACVAAEVPVWHPHQLRHNAGTAIRKTYGLEAAQVILGHSTADVTQIYAETDRAKALAVIAEMG